MVKLDMAKWCRTLWTINWKLGLVRQWRSWWMSECHRIESYCTDRSQTVTIGNNSSVPTHVASGVPQGTYRPWSSSFQHLYFPYCFYCLLFFCPSAAICWWLTTLYSLSPLTSPAKSIALKNVWLPCTNHAPILWNIFPKHLHQPTPFEASLLTCLCYWCYLLPNFRLSFTQSLSCSLKIISTWYFRFIIVSFIDSWPVFIQHSSFSLQCSISNVYSVLDVIYQHALRSSILVANCDTKQPRLLKWFVSMRWVQSQSLMDWCTP